MRLHRNAPLSSRGRGRLAARVVGEGWTARCAAAAAGVIVRCARKWVVRFEEGELRLRDRSSAPKRVANRTPQSRRGRTVAWACGPPQGPRGIRHRTRAPRRSGSLIQDAARLRTASRKSGPTVKNSLAEGSSPRAPAARRWGAGLKPNSQSGASSYIVADCERRRLLAGGDGPRLDVDARNLFSSASSERPERPLRPRKLGGLLGRKKVGEAKRSRALLTSEAFTHGCRRLGSMPGGEL